MLMMTSNNKGSLKVKNQSTISMFILASALTAISSLGVYAETTTSTAPSAAATATPEVKKESTTPFEKPIKGRIMEKINASSYTYLKLKTETEDIWVAVPQLEIKLNTEVELQKPIPMFGFESKTLKKKFDRIYFGILKSQKEELLKKAKKNKK